ncbi:MAG: T9SS type A sorting domain-containing protein, partial [Candidatus Marinimicrobia bacterium]|nr:T9SS type A sorting domain-containing protein [Candidatus Neomarinimicrobiota bacterium]
ILAGSGSNLFVIDIKEMGTIAGYWNQFQGGYERRGSTPLGGCTNDVYCNYNSDVLWHDGSCSNKTYTCSDGTLGCDCSGECNGVSVEDCSGICQGNATLDICGECNGDGPADGFDCEGNPLEILMNELPQQFELLPVYPNPFNPSATINYQIETFGKTTLTIYDVGGRIVEVLRNEYEHPGQYSLRWDADYLAAGIYLLRLESGKFSQNQKMVLLK